MKFKLTNSKVFLLLAVAAIAILAWGIYTALSRDDEEDTDIAAPAAGGSPAGTKAGNAAVGGDVLNVGVGDSVEFVVRDARGNIKK